MIKNVINISRDDVSETSDVIRRINKCSNKTNHKFNIDLSSLPETYVGLLKNRKFIKHYVNDDKLLNILFYCLDQENDHRSYDTVYYIRDIDRLVMQRNLYKLDRIDFWKCSFCENEIEIDNSKKISHHHFLCSDCKDEYTNTTKIDARIINNFNEYSESVNENLKKKYKVLLSKMKKNNKS